jgi:uncharacterized protein YodC (DUF2158 family)
MADEKFKLGDVVSLRSGGPRMTIATVDGQSSFLRMVYRRPTTAKQIFLPHQFEARRSAMNEWVYTADRSREQRSFPWLRHGKCRGLCAPPNNVGFRRTLALPTSALGHDRPKGDVRIESVYLPTVDIGPRSPQVAFVPMCGRLRVGKSFFHVAGLVGEAMCSACLRGLHDRWP